MPWATPGSADIAMPLAARPWYFFMASRPAYSPCAPGVRLHADRIVAGHLHQPAFQIQQQLVALGLA